MRIDHFAYQRATRVAGFGFFLQLTIGLVLLVFALTTGEGGDTPLLLSSLYVLAGLPVWLSLIVLFHQHKLERLEALEEDELAGGREGGSFFEESAEGTRVAARRLARMHRWMMPAASLVVVAILALLAWLIIGGLTVVDTDGQRILDPTVFALTPAPGWAVSICLAFAAVCFIFSRFVAGMARQVAWQNLRAGAGWMVGNTLVLLAVAIGVIFRFFDNQSVLEVIVFAIPALMIVQALEIVVNFVLNIYRPRVPGETPRPAFDSKLLAYAAAPDSLVRSINEAINYQFGFDVTSTWGYKLLVRSFARLVGIGVVVLLLLSCLVVVEPHQQAVKLRMGRIVGDGVHEAGLMIKLPWPFERAVVQDVTRIRELPLTAQRLGRIDIDLWSSREEPRTDREIEPFLVGASRFEFEDVDPAIVEAVEVDTPGDPEDAPPPEVAAVSRSYALVDAELSLHYHIRQDSGGLLDYLRFAPETRGRRETLTPREQALRDIALREVSLGLSSMTLDQVLARRRGGIADALRGRIQAAFDAHRAGVEVVAVGIPMLRPTRNAVANWEDFSMAAEDQRKSLARAEEMSLRTLSYLIGDPKLADPIVAGIREHGELVELHGSDAPEVLEQQAAIEALLMRGGGKAANDIATAYADQWKTLLQRREQAVRVQGQLAGYNASPELYYERELMRIWRDRMATAHRIILLGVDPERINLDMQFKELDTRLDFGSTLEQSGASEGNSP